MWDGSYGFRDGELLPGGYWRCLWLAHGTGSVSAGQLFLDTGSTPTMRVGRTYTYRLAKDGSLVTALADNKPVAAAPLDRVRSWSLGSRIGLYT